DDPVQSPASAALMGRVESGAEQVDVRDAVLTETVWTLASYFRVPRPEIADKLAAILELRGVRTANKRVLVNALARYASTNADFVDCLLAATAKQRGTDVLT